MSRKLLANNLTTQAFSEKFEDDYVKIASTLRPALKGFVESLLFQDQIVVPFADFTTVSVLMKTFGERNIIGLLENESLSFIRYKGIVGALQVVGGSKITLDVLVPTEPRGLIHSRYLDSERALDHALKSIESWKINPKLRKKILKNTTNFNLNQALKDILEATKKDISELASASNKKPESKDWAALGEFNLNLSMGKHTKCADYSIEEPKANILRSKISKISSKQDRFEAATALTQIAGVSDIGELVLDGVLPFDSLLKIRNSKDGEQFREWFNSLRTDEVERDTVNIAQQYDALIQSRLATDGITAKATRMVLFILTSSYFDSLTQNTNYQSLPLAIALGLSTIDTFLLDKIIQPHSPKFFITRTKELVAKSR